MNAGLSIEPERERHYGRWVLAFVTLCSIVISGWYIYQWYMTGMQPPVPIPIAKADPSIDESDVSSAMIAAYEVPASHPRYISIPSIGVGKTRVYPVSVTDQNMLDTPRNINDTAWYKKSATPGQGYGAVLIDGHNGGNSKNGVFAKLSTLKEGDEIVIERGDSQIYKYQVVESQTMNLDQVNSTGMKMMMESVDPNKEGLSLITCAGTWIPRLQQFDQRVMVRAVAEQ
jgi:LPXTG-site transpeptidase (sortase) family protein